MNFYFVILLVLLGKILTFACVKIFLIMSEKYYIRRFVQSGGLYIADGDAKSIEDDFGYCRYKSITNMNVFGAPKMCYEETFVEDIGSKVWLGSVNVYEPITHELSLYFFGMSPEEQTAGISSSVQIQNAEKSWSAFIDWISGHLLVWWDEGERARGLKSLCYVKESPEVNSDIIKGVPYLECVVKLENILGRSFPKDDMTIETLLSSGGV